MVERQSPRSSQTAVYVGAGPNRSDVIDLLLDYNYTTVPSIHMAEMLMLIGYEDINPNFYSEKAIQGTVFSDAKDKDDVSLYNQGVLRKLPMVGINRGALFLNVMNGGSCWQNIDEHRRHTHLIEDLLTGERFEASSLHHQSMIPSDKGIVTAVAYKSNTRKCEDYSLQDDEYPDIEAVVYPDTKTVCYQPNPELANINFKLEDCAKYLFKLIEEVCFKCVD